MKHKLQELKEAFKNFRYGLAYLIAPDWIDDLESRFSIFLLNQTGKLSKCYYSVDTMIRAANDYQQSICDECEYYIECNKKESENKNVRAEEL